MGRVEAVAKFKILLVEKIKLSDGDSALYTSLDNNTTHECGVLVRVGGRGGTVEKLRAQLFICTLFLWRWEAGFRKRGNRTKY